MFSYNFKQFLSDVVDGTSLCLMSFSVIYTIVFLITLNQSVHDINDLTLRLALLVITSAFWAWGISNSTSPGRMVAIGSHRRFDTVKGATQIAVWELVIVLTCTIVSGVILVEFFDVPSLSALILMSAAIPASCVILAFYRYTTTDWSFHS